MADDEKSKRVRTRLQLRAATGRKILQRFMRGTGDTVELIAIVVTRSVVEISERKTELDWIKERRQCAFSFYQCFLDSAVSMSFLSVALGSRAACASAICRPAGPPSIINAEIASNLTNCDSSAFFAAVADDRRRK